MNPLGDPAVTGSRAAWCRRTLLYKQTQSGQARLAPGNRWCQTKPIGGGRKQAVHRYKQSQFGGPAPAGPPRPGVRGPLCETKPIAGVPGHRAQPDRTKQSQLARGRGSQTRSMVFGDPRSPYLGLPRQTKPIGEPPPSGRGPTVPNKPNQRRPVVQTKPTASRREYKAAAFLDPCPFDFAQGGPCAGVTTPARLIVRNKANCRRFQGRSFTFEAARTSTPCHLGLRTSRLAKKRLAARLPTRLCRAKQSQFCGKCVSIQVLR